MSDFSPTSTPDLSTLAERERGELRRRTGIGVIIATIMLAFLATFVAVEPDRTGSVLLAAGILAGVCLISWMRHCGSAHEHKRLRQQNTEILALARKVIKSADDADRKHREALEAMRIEHRQALENAGEHFNTALRDLAERLDANERVRRLEDAKRIASRICEHLDHADPPEQPEMGRAVLHSVAANTPARGFRDVDGLRRLREEQEGERFDG
jgi:pyruvate/2-oxoacid:ferredoxin oxidoreductase beta subunit